MHNEEILYSQTTFKINILEEIILEYLFRAPAYFLNRHKDLEALIKIPIWFFWINRSKKNYKTRENVTYNIDRIETH